MAAPMSTPVQNLPPSSNTGAPMIDDPTIRDVLKEMDAEVAAATAANRPVHSQGPPQAHHPHAQAAQAAQSQAAMMMHNYPFMASPHGNGGFDTEIAKRALIAAVLSAVLFHPMLTQMLGSRLPILTTNEMYMSAARVLLLAVVFYIVMWKFDI